MYDVRLTCCFVWLLASGTLATATDDPKVPAAWGKPVNGLQAGLRVSTSKVWVTSTVLKIVVRNVGTKAAEFSYAELAFEGENVQGVVTGKGAEVGSGLTPLGTRFRVKVKAGEEYAIATLPLFRPGEGGLLPTPKVRIGMNHIGAEGIRVRLPNGKEFKLTTGYLDVSIAPAKK